ncbi:methyl-accepting chemotaxis protein [Clostridium sp. WILCCON 0269]|uniref:Methyl-accepting chemotaxis protein n=1 Tax=Candidatus Clostridium eludens TaxID=3381663 RepID=A0ABW8SLM5_9CLOT
MFKIKYSKLLNLLDKIKMKISKFNLPFRNKIKVSKFNLPFRNKIKISKLNLPFGNKIRIGKFNLSFPKIKKFNLLFLNSVVVKIIAQIGILVILICGVLGVIACYSSYRTMEKSIDSSLRDRAVESSKLIASMLKQESRVMTEIADREEIKSMVPDLQIPVLAKRAQELNYASLNVMDLNGLAYMQSGGKTQINLDSSDSKYLKSALNGNVEIEGPYFNVNGDQIIAVAVPIKNDNNKVVGVLFSNISMVELNKLVQSMKIGQSGYCFIIDKDGTKVVHKNLTLVLNKDNTIKNAQKDKSLTALADLEKNMINGKSGSGYYSEDGKGMFMAYSPIPNSNWSLGLTIDQKEIFSEVQVLKYKIISMTVVFILIGLFIGLFIAGTIKKPLLKIRKYALELSKFNLGYRIKIKEKDEFGDTAAALNYAMDDIAGIIEQVEKQSSQTLESTNNVNEMFEKSNVELRMVSDKSSQISSNMEKTLFSVEEVNKKILKVKDKIQNVVEEADEGLVLTENIKKKAAYIKKNTENSKYSLESYYVKSSKELRRALESVKVVSTVSEMAEKIRNISKRTNLLALNARIEAVRAGEYGKGFMVVAEEVRKLAVQSSDMVNSIQENVKDILISVVELSDSAEGILKMIENNILSDYEKVIKISNEYEEDGMRFKLVIQRFSELTENINQSSMEINEIMCSIVDSVNQCTNASIDISDNIGEIENENKSISIYTMENESRAKELLHILNNLMLKNK